MADWRKELREGHYLYIAATWLEGIVAALLIVLTGIGIVGLVRAIRAVVVAPDIALSGGLYYQVIDATLTIFVVIELFKIAVAYMRHEDVVPTVMEAALVAVARKLVVFDTHIPATEMLLRASALTLLLVGVAGAWFVIARRSRGRAEAEPTS